MADHLKFERYCWFDRQVKGGRYPNAASLARRFKISTKTAQRNIEPMRDRLLAPLECDNRRKGYYYTGASFALPSPRVTQNELLAPKGLRDEILGKLWRMAAFVWRALIGAWMNGRTKAHQKFLEVGIWMRERKA
jgi:hypothetical protein